MKIIIERFNGKKKYEQSYRVDEADMEGKTLLSLLLFIKKTQDITLNFTASCQSAICGACAVRVNNHSYLACDTKMKDLLQEYDYPESIRIAPLGNFRVISDLVVDWEPSIENLRKIKPAMVAKKEFSKEKGCKQTQAEFDRISKQWDCILCGSCASECNKLEADSSDYMQPFVFTHAWRAANDSRGANPMMHLKPSVENGLWLCVHCEECANRCPKGISSVEDIANLRAMAIKKGLDDGVGPDHAKAFYEDLVDGSGRLNEIHLAIRSDGVFGSLGKTDIAFNLIFAGKMNPMHIFGDDEIEGYENLSKMIKAAQSAENKE